MQNPLPSASPLKKGDNLLAHFFKRGTKGEGLEVKPVTVTNLSTFQPFNHSTNYPSPFTLHPSRKRAFTLAEVLITLGIIGVVAALVMPMLISKYEKHTIEVGLKKTYSDLANLIQRSEADNGTYEQWDFSFGDKTQAQATKAFVEKYFAPYINLTPCDGKKQKCFAALAGSDSNRWLSPDGNYGSDGDSDYFGSKYILDDGRSICFKLININTEQFFINITVDVNGQRGKSVNGVDVFKFSLSNYYRYNNPKLPIKGFHAGSGVNGGYANNPVNIEKLCHQLAGGIHYCSLVIQRNNWKFPKDYPWIK